MKLKKKKSENIEPHFSQQGITITVGNPDHMSDYWHWVAMWINGFEENIRKYKNHGRTIQNNKKQ